VGDLRTKGRLPLRLKQVSRREDAVLFGHPFLNDRHDASCCPQSPELISRGKSARGLRAAVGG
jgi:hypothetical protein